MSGSQIIGALIVGAFVIGLFALVASTDGWRFAAVGLTGSAGAALLFAYGVHLLTGEPWPLW